MLLRALEPTHRRDAPPPRPPRRMGPLLLGKLAQSRTWSRRVDRRPFALEPPAGPVAAGSDAAIGTTEGGRRSLALRPQGDELVVARPTINFILRPAVTPGCGVWSSTDPSGPFAWPLERCPCLDRTEP